MTNVAPPRLTSQTQHGGHTTSSTPGTTTYTKDKPNMPPIRHTITPAGPSKTALQPTPGTSKNPPSAPGTSTAKNAGNAPGGGGHGNSGSGK